MQARERNRPIETNPRIYFFQLALSATFYHLPIMSVIIWAYEKMNPLASSKLLASKDYWRYLCWHTVKYASLIS